MVRLSLGLYTPFRNPAALSCIARAFAELVVKCVSQRTASDPHLIVTLYRPGEDQSSLTSITCPVQRTRWPANMRCQFAFRCACVYWRPWRTSW